MPRTARTRLSWSTAHVFAPLDRMYRRLDNGPRESVPTTPTGTVESD